MPPSAETDLLTWYRCFLIFWLFLDQLINRTYGTIIRDLIVQEYTNSKEEQWMMIFLMISTNVSYYTLYNEMKSTMKIGNKISEPSSKSWRMKEHLTRKIEGTELDASRRENIKVGSSSKWNNKRTNECTRQCEWEKTTRMIWTLVL